MKQLYRNAVCMSVIFLMLLLLLQTHSNNGVFVLCILILLFSFYEVSGGNILFVFAGGTYSHEIAIAPLVKSLADKGHKVSFLSSYTKKPFTHSKVEIIAPKVLVDNIENNFEEEKLSVRLASREKEIWYQFPDWAIGICKILLDNPGDNSLRNLFYTNRTFDLVIVDAAINDCGFIIAHYFNAKTIVSDSTTVLPWHYHNYGLPFESSSIPVMSSHFNYPMTLKTRLQNFLEPFYWIYRRHTYVYPELEALMKKFLKKKENIPNFIDLERNTSLILLNAHPSIDFPRSLPPLFVNVGGMQCWDVAKEKISLEVEKFLNEAKNGTVLIVFGTTVNLANMPQSIISSFFRAIEHFENFNFIWKWVGEKPANHPKNLMMLPWLPQKEILGHHSVKAFITHCGLNSLIEATFHSVPVVGIPLFGDQDLIAFRIQAEEIGTRIEVREITAATIISSLSSVLNQPKYKDNMRKMSLAFRDRPQNPIENALYWVEYVLRMDDTSFLRPKNLNQELHERYSLDIILILISLLIVTIGILIIIVIVVFCGVKKYFVKSKEGVRLQKHEKVFKNTISQKRKVK